MVCYLFIGIISTAEQQIFLVKIQFDINAFRMHNFTW